MSQGLTAVIRQQSDYLLSWRCLFYHRGVSGFEKNQVVVWVPSGGVMSWKPLLCWQTASPDYYCSLYGSQHTGWNWGELQKVRHSWSPQRWCWGTMEVPSVTQRWWSKCSRRLLSHRSKAGSKQLSIQLHITWLQLITAVNYGVAHLIARCGGEKNLSVIASRLQQLQKSVCPCCHDHEGRKVIENNLLKHKEEEKPAELG